jgi:hypothetical protein
MNPLNKYFPVKDAENWNKNTIRTTYHDSPSVQRQKPVRFDVHECHHDLEPWYASRQRYHQLGAELELWRHERAERAKKYQDSTDLAKWFAIAIALMFGYFFIKHFLRF